MMFDLTQALGAAAEQATAARPSIAPRPVLQRIRRRRAVRVATESTVGVAAAGAVAFAGVQLAGRDEPVPPASPTATPTPTAAPTPSPSPAALVTATGDLACGLPVPTLDDPVGDADVHLVLEPAALRAPAGAGVDLTVTVVNGTATVAEAPETLGPRVLVARDGVVVGALMTDTEYAVAERLDAGATATRSGPHRVSSCTALGLGDPPLAAGEYELYATWRLGMADEVAGGPWPLTIEQPADPHPALADLVLSTWGLGPLTIGLPPETNPGAAMITFDPAYCADVRSDGADPGRWVEAGYEDDPDRGRLSVPFGVAVEDGRITWIDVYSDGPRTAEGIGIGSTLAELQGAYPALSGPHEAPVSRVWWLEGPTGTLVFETQGDEPGLQPAGTPETVILARVLAPGISPLFGTANSDHMAGGCL